jgi:sugar phosphate isomerase/epimerase
MPSHIAAQLYTLREFTKTPADIASTLKRVRKIGYEAVQASALGKIDPKELKKIFDGEGLICCATHFQLDRFRNETQAVIDEHALWGCKWTAIGGFFPKEATKQTWIDFAKDFSNVARTIDKGSNGALQLGYHNHSHELGHYDGKPALQHMLDTFDPKLWMEIDTYWIQHGGGDPAAWIDKVKGRIPCVHLKDMDVTLTRTQLMAEIGEGNLNWNAILPACKRAGVEWYIIEQDDCYGKEPFECLATSLRNTKAMGIE